MILKKLVVGPIMANCYLIGDDETREGAIIDPGDDADRIVDLVERTDLDIIYILATHGHFDHTGGIGPLKRKIDRDFLIHEGDLFFVEDSKGSAERWGVKIEQVPDPDGFLEDGQVLKLGSLELSVMHTPGHSPGGVCLYLAGEGAVFSGDTLFQGSIGRTDFRMGSMADLKRSIKQRLYKLPGDTKVYTGHGPETTIDEEKRYNAFVRG